jgi:hypothetical protein
MGTDRSAKGEPVMGCGTLTMQCAQTMHSGTDGSHRNSGGRIFGIAERSSAGFLHGYRRGSMGLRHRA